MDDEKRPAGEWCRISGIKMLNPDGWRIAGRTWFESITRSEFDRMASTSTIEMKRPA
jgi:hypothetical protein